MSAFVPAPGLALASSRATFATGSSVHPASRDGDAALRRSPCTPTMIKMPNLPKMPNFGDSNKPTPAKKRPVGSKVVFKAPSPASISLVSAATANPKLPKFYNPSTARAQFSATALGQCATPYDVRLDPGVTPTNERENSDDTFRNMDEYTTELVWARSDWSSDEARVAVNVTIRNVFGNAHLFASELEEFATAISCVTRTADVKEFVRALGLSHAYRSRFFEPMSNMRFVELNFVHFLGRAPRSQAEISEHIAIITEQGYNAEINSYLDSGEYDAQFGKSRIPAANFRGSYESNVDVNKLATLKGGYATSDRSSTRACFPSALHATISSFSVSKGLPEAWRGENAARAAAGVVSEFPDVFWNAKPDQLRTAELRWKMNYGVWNNFWYKDSIVYKSIMKPQLSHTDEEIREAEAVLKWGSNMAKLYTTPRKMFDFAPVIEVTSPTDPGGYNGRVRIQMEKITFSIPSELNQMV